MEWTKQIPSMAEHLAPFAWREDETAHKTTASKNYYEWYYTYSYTLHPGIVAEIGVQRGYSAISMLMGYPAMRRLYLFDNESYGYSLATAVQQIRQAQIKIYSFTDIQAFLLDTQKVGALPIPNGLDLAHVDGDHTRDGAMHDLELVARLINPGGCIILDDLNQPEVERAAVAFMDAHREFIHQRIPTYTQHQLSIRIAPATQ